MLKRLCFSCVVFFLTISVHAQSKKDLLVKVKQKDSLINVLLEKIDSLNAEITDLTNFQVSLEQNLNEEINRSLLIQIGDQIWDHENLKVTQLNDGKQLVYADTKEKWDECFRNKTPAYCVHINDTLNTFGYLYNVFAVQSGKLAPKGWKLPTRKDFDVLIENLSMMSPTGSKLIKATASELNGIPNWNTPGLDIFHFGIRPYGFRMNDRNQWYFGNKVYFWSTTDDYPKVSLLSIGEYNDLPFVVDKELDQENYGLYVRCIKIK